MRKKNLVHQAFARWEEGQLLSRRVVTGLECDTADLE